MIIEDGSWEPTEYSSLASCLAYLLACQSPVPPKAVCLSLSLFALFSVAQSGGQRMRRGR